jgi:hypothetical protein
MPGRFVETGTPRQLHSGYRMNPLRNTRDNVALVALTRGSSQCRRTTTSWRSPACACAKRARHGRLLPLLNCNGWRKNTRTAPQPQSDETHRTSERAYRCPRTPRRLHPSHSSNSSRKSTPSRPRRLPQSVHGMKWTTLSTGVSAPKDFAPERRCSQTVVVGW